MARVIQISGKKRHGKDSVASILANKFPGCKLYSYAEPMKQILATVLNVSLSELDHLKNNNNEYRVMLQKMGNEAIKPIFGDSVWRDLMDKKLKALPDDTIVLIPDWRFIVEELPEAFKLRVNRPSVPMGHDSHPSEVELDGYEGFTYTLQNPEGISELNAEIDKLVPIIKEFFKIEEPEIITTPIEEGVIGDL